MAFASGSVAVFKMDSTESGSLTDLSAYTTSVKFSRTRKDLTLPLIGGNGVKRLPGNQENTIDLEGFIHPTVTAAFTTGLIDAPVTRSFEYDPQGTGTGTDKRTGEAFILEYHEDTDGENAGKWTAKLGVDGDVTDASNA